MGPGDGLDMEVGERQVASAGSCTSSDGLTRADGYISRNSAS